MNPKNFFYALMGGLVLVLGAGGAGYYFAFGMLRTQATSLAGKLATSEAADTQISKLSVIQHQYDRDIVPILGLMDEALPHEKKQTEILAQLQNIAGQTGLAITSVTMPSPQGVPGLTSQTIRSGAVLALPISFQLSGSYSQLQTFSQKVEVFNRFTNVTNLAISRPDKNKPIVYSFSLNAYIMP